MRRRCPNCLRASGSAHCCGATKSPIDSIIAPWPYTEPIDAVLQAFKFRRLSFLGEDLADLLCEELKGHLSGDEVVTAVPLHWWRRFRRGFDQAERIARPLAKRLGLPYERLLHRSRFTAAQTSLGRDRRRRNLEQAFTTPGRFERSVLLVDDVLTTGATMEAAALALRHAGATRIVAAAIAATPFRRHGSA